jgi:hypothetical protein
MRMDDRKQHHLSLICIFRWERWIYSYHTYIYTSPYKLGEMGDDVKAALREALKVLEDGELTIIAGTRSGILKNSRTPMEMTSFLPPGSSRMDDCPASPDIPEEKESAEAFSAGLPR